MKYSDLMNELQSLGIRMSKRALQQYASSRFGLVDEPVVRERGGPAEFAPEALAEVYAAYHLLHRDKISYKLIRQARQIGRYLETTNYRSLPDILNDTDVRKLIYKKPKETFYAFEWLWLKYSAMPEKELPVDHAIRGILIGLAETEDFYIEALQSGEYKEDV